MTRCRLQTANCSAASRALHGPFSRNNICCAHHVPNFKKLPGRTWQDCRLDRPKLFSTGLDGGNLQQDSASAARLAQLNQRSSTEGTQPAAAAIPRLPTLSSSTTCSRLTRKQASALAKEVRCLLFNPLLSVTKYKARQGFLTARAGTKKTS